MSGENPREHERVVRRPLAERDERLLHLEVVGGGSADERLLASVLRREEQRDFFPVSGERVEEQDARAARVAEERTGKRANRRGDGGGRVGLEPRAEPGDDLEVARRGERRDAALGVAPLGELARR